MRSHAGTVRKSPSGTMADRAVAPKIIQVAQVLVITVSSIVEETDQVLTTQIIFEENTRYNYTHTQYIYIRKETSRSNCTSAFARLVLVIAA